MTIVTEDGVLVVKNKAAKRIEDYADYRRYRKEKGLQFVRVEGKVAKLLEAEIRRKHVDHVDSLSDRQMKRHERRCVKNIWFLFNLITISKEYIEEAVSVVGHINKQLGILEKRGLFSSKYNKYGYDILTNSYSLFHIYQNIRAVLVKPDEAFRIFLEEAFDKVSDETLMRCMYIHLISGSNDIAYKSDKIIQEVVINEISKRNLSWVHKKHSSLLQQDISEAGFHKDLYKYSNCFERNCSIRGCVVAAIRSIYLKSDSIALKMLSYIEGNMMQYIKEDSVESCPVSALITAWKDSKDGTLTGKSLVRILCPASFSKKMLYELDHLSYAPISSRVKDKVIKIVRRIIEFNENQLRDIILDKKFMRSLRSKYPKVWSLIEDISGYKGHDYVSVFSIRRYIDKYQHVHSIQLLDKICADLEGRSNALYHRRSSCYQALVPKRIYNQMAKYNLTDEEIDEVNHELIKALSELLKVEKGRIDKVLTNYNIALESELLEEYKNATELVDSMKELKSVMKAAAEDGDVIQKRVECSEGLAEMLQEIDHHEVNAGRTAGVTDLHRQDPKMTIPGISVRDVSNVLAPSSRSV